MHNQMRLAATGQDNREAVDFSIVLKYIATCAGL